jgi:hypothetical protein
VVLGPGGMEYPLNERTDHVVSLSGSEVVAKRETGAKAADDKVVVGAVVGLNFISKID